MTKIYRKNDSEIVVNDKFIYCDTIYIKYNNGVALYSEKYLSSKNPINLKKQKKRKKSRLLRFFDLQYAPEKWLEQQGYELIYNN